MSRQYNVYKFIGQFRGFNKFLKISDKIKTKASFIRHFIDNVYVGLYNLVTHSDFLYVVRLLKL